MTAIHLVRHHLLAALFLASLGTLTAQLLAADQNTQPAESALHIASPGERSVMQRDQKNLGRVPVRCTAEGDSVEVRALEKNSRKPVKDWTPLASANGSFAVALELPAGWYELELRAKKSGQVVQAGTVQCVGVGDVFVTAGQSNSANYGQPRQAAKADWVSTCDFQTGQWRHADDPQPGASGGGGSPWPLLGELVSARTGLPVGFICVGVGSTRVSQWAPAGNCYPRLKKALELAGPNGCRAVLWHQGESDSIAGTSSATYAQTLTQAIEQSRADAGWQVPWGVALVSFHPAPQATADRQKAVIAGQQQVIKECRDVFQGPTTDGFSTRGFLNDTVHFNAKGLAAHAKGWLDALP